MPLISGYIEECLRGYMFSHGFFYVKTPLINDRFTHKIDTVSLDFMEEKFEISSSHALYLGALSAIYGKVYSLQPVLRKESDYDENHLLEFNLLEAEWQEADYNQMLLFLEGLLSDVITKFNKYIIQNNLCEYFHIVNNLHFPLRRINYHDVQNNELTTGNELITDDYGMYDKGISTSMNEPYFIMFYPPKASWRAKVISKDKAFIFNLILPERYGELAECSVRETSTKMLEHKFQCAKMASQMAWYLEASRYNQYPRCGFGLGIGRLCRWLMALDSIDMTEAFPRKM